MGILGTLGKAALGAVKGITTGGGIGGAISGATGGGGSVVDRAIGAIGNRGSSSGPNMTSGAGNPAGVMNLSGGSSAASPASTPEVTAPRTSKRSVRGGRGFTSGRRG